MNWSLNFKCAKVQITDDNAIIELRWLTRLDCS